MTEANWNVLHKDIDLQSANSFPHICHIDLLVMLKEAITRRGQWSTKGKKAIHEVPIGAKEILMWRFLFQFSNIPEALTYLNWSHQFGCMETSIQAFIKCIHCRNLCNLCPWFLEVSHIQMKHRLEFIKFGWGNGVWNQINDVVRGRLQFLYQVSMKLNHFQCVFELMLVNRWCVI